MSPKENMVADGSMAGNEGHLVGGMVRRLDRLFVLTVLLPTAFAAVYFGIFASDVFVSESHFVVSGPERPASGGLTALLQGVGGGFNRSLEDSYNVADFMTSRDALRVLEDELHLKDAFGSSEVDLLNRFGGLDWDDSFEALHKYYQKRVSVGVDAATPVSILTTEAFTPVDAYRINERLLELSEDLVNRLNERGRQDMIRYGETLVRDAEERARKATVAVAEYRHLQSVFDPEKQSALRLEQISTLQGDLSVAKARLSQIQKQAKDNPQITTLQRMVEATQAEIDAETGKVAGGQTSLAKKVVAYEALVLEQTLAERQLETALASLVQARDEAQRKRLYLERIVQPSKPDVALQPRRLRNVVVTMLLGLIAWGIVSLLVAGVREHRD